MTEFDSSHSQLLADGSKPAIPQRLNVLTILTFIGSGLGLLFILLTPAINRFFLSMMDKAQTSGAELTAKQLKDIEDGRAVIALTQNNIVPIIIIGVVGIALCIVGAVWMRRLKKDGFWIYSAGELFPIIANFIILGTAQYTNVFSVIIGVAVPVIFVILYATQRKYLVH